MNEMRIERRVRRSREGMTLVEIMVVVIIIALIATAVGIAVFPQWKKAQIKNSEAGAQTVRSAVELYKMQNPGADCPTTDALVADGQMDRSKSKNDSWGNAFSIVCEGDNIVVTSAGPDGQQGTEDDISTAPRERQ